MSHLKYTLRLKNQIQLLEVEQYEKGQILKEQFMVIYDSLKPINLIKSTLKEITTSPILGDNVLGSIMGLGTGYLSRKIVVGGSANPFRKIFGYLLQMGVANTVANHPEIIRMFSQYFAKFIQHRKDVKSKEL